MVTLLFLLSVWAEAGDFEGREATLVMHERFAYATMMRTALIHGFLERATRHAGQLRATVDQMATDEVREAAERAAAATTLAEVAAGTARVADACGSCHEAREVRVLVVADQQPSWRDTVQARMGRHIWAADRMWAGLIGHDEGSWLRGAELLTSDPFLSSGAGGVSPEQLAEISALAEESRTAPSWGARAEAYGRFLASCAACHADGGS